MATVLLDNTGAGGTTSNSGTHGLSVGDNHRLFIVNEADALVRGTITVSSSNGTHLTHDFTVDGAVESNGENLPNVATAAVTPVFNIPTGSTSIIVEFSNVGTAHRTSAQTGERLFAFSRV